MSMESHQRIPHQQLEQLESEFSIPEAQKFRQKHSLFQRKFCLLVAIFCLILGLVFYQFFDSSAEKELKTVSIPLKQESNLTVVMWACEDTANDIEDALDSFLKINTYPIAQFILIQADSLEFESLRKVRKYGNLTIMIGRGESKLFLIDKAYSMVRTSYVFYLSASFKTTKDVASIQISILQKDPKIIQIWGVKTKEDSVSITLANRDRFFFSPHIFRMKDYESIPGGNFTALVNRISPVSQYDEVIIHDYFKEVKYQIVKGETVFLPHEQNQELDYDLPSSEVRELMKKKVKILCSEIKQKQKQTEDALKAEEAIQKEKIKQISQLPLKEQQLKQKQKQIEEREIELKKMMSTINEKEGQIRTKEENLNEKQLEFKKKVQEENQKQQRESRRKKQEQEEQRKEEQIKEDQRKEEERKKEEEEQKKEEQEKKRKKIEKRKGEVRSIPIDFNSNLTVVMLTCCNKHDQMVEVIDSFLDINTYPIAGFIIINDNKELSGKFVEIERMYSNLTTIVTGIKGGQLYTIDMVYSMIKTPYVFYLEDDFKMLKDIAKKSIESLEKDPKVLQTWSTKAVQVNITKDGYIEKTVHHWSSFSFNPHVFRMSVYHSIPGGSFSALTDYLSYGFGAGHAEGMIHDYFLTTQYQVLRGDIAFEHIRDHQGSWRFTAPKGFERKFIVHDPVFGKGMKDIHNESQVAKQTLEESYETNHTTSQDQFYYPKTIHIDIESNLTVVMLIHDHENATIAIDSFLNLNTHPISQFIVINDGSPSDDLISAVNNYINLTVVNTGIKGGELFAFDLVYSMVRSAYVFYLDNRFEMLRDVASEQMQVMQADPKVIQIWSSREKTVNTTGNGYIKKSIQHHSGFLLEPHVFRMEIYKNVPGGFSGLTSNVSFGMGAGDAAILIQDYFLASEYETVLGERAFAQIKSHQKQYQFPAGYKRAVNVHEQEP